jgi:hypothetical protein
VSGTVCNLARDAGDLARDANIARNAGDLARDANVTKCYKMLQNVTKCYKMLRNVTKCNVTKCYEMLRNVTKCYKRGNRAGGQIRPWPDPGYGASRTLDTELAGPYTNLAGPYTNLAGPYTLSAGSSHGPAKTKPHHGFPCN